MLPNQGAFCIKGRIVRSPPERGQGREGAGPLPAEGRTVRKVGWGASPGLLFQAVSLEAASPLSGFCLPRAWAPGRAPPARLLCPLCSPAPSPGCGFCFCPFSFGAVQTLPGAPGPCVRSSILAVQGARPRGPSCTDPLHRLPPWSKERPTPVRPAEGEQVRPAGLRKLAAVSSAPFFFCLLAAHSEPALGSAWIFRVVTGARCL